MLVHFWYIYTYLCHISVGYFHIAVSRMLLVYIFISCLTFHLWNTWCRYCFCCYLLSILLSTCSSVFWLHLAQRSFISCQFTVQKSRKISYWVIDLSFAFDSEWQRMSLYLLTYLAVSQFHLHMYKLQATWCWGLHCCMASLRRWRSQQWQRCYQVSLRLIRCVTLTTFSDVFQLTAMMSLLSFDSCLTSTAKSVFLFTLLQFTDTRDS